jgi:two-component system nitrogen regulation response regulator GlnG
VRTIAVRDTATFAGEPIRRIGALRVVDGPDRGLELVLEHDRATLGTGVAADLRLTDRSVSRLHVEIVRTDEGLRIRDLGSKNGTWISECRVGEAWIVPGARMRLGATVLEASVTQGIRRELVWEGPDRFGALAGASPAAHQLFAAMERVGSSDVRVLLRGESGTGKELVAREIHRVSERSEGPFVVVDGAAMGKTLADDELFGHVRGAYTGAGGDKPGAFERAHRGTLFLDEVGELAIEVQAKLLRAIDTGTVQRLGGTKRTEVDVRVIAATHRPLERMVNEGSFREDLLHRLLVATLHVPPLRDRPLDVPLLAHELLADLVPGDAAADAALASALSERVGYLWPGNVRELRNFVQRVAFLGSSNVDLGHRGSDFPTVEVDRPFHEAKARWVGFFERQYVMRILGETGGNVSEAARRAGLSRVHLGKLAGRHRKRGSHDG